MRVAVVGSKGWTNYNEVIRQLTLLVEDFASTAPDDKRLTLVHTGARGAENMVTEWVGQVESYLRQKGYTVKDEVYRLKEIEGVGRLPVARDNKILESGVDSVLVFMKSPCKRTESFARMAKAYEIPTTVVKG